MLKMWALYFYSCPALGNSLSVPQNVHDFRYRKSTLNNIVKSRSILTSSGSFYATVQKRLALDC